MVRPGGFLGSVGGAMGRSGFGVGGAFGGEVRVVLDEPCLDGDDVDAGVACVPGLVLDDDDLLLDSLDSDAGGSGKGAGAGLDGGVSSNISMTSLAPPPPAVGGPAGWL